MLPSVPRSLRRTTLPGLAELKKGEYERAVKLLSARLAKNPSDAEAQKHLLRAYIETGRYAEAEAAARKFLEKTPEAGGVRTSWARAWRRPDRYAEAIGEFERGGARRRRRPESCRPSVWRATCAAREVLEATGQEERAREIFQSLVSYYNENEPETAPELTLVARALAHLEKYKDANDLYMAADRRPTRRTSRRTSAAASCSRKSTTTPRRRSSSRDALEDQPEQRARASGRRRQQAARRRRGDVGRARARA